MRKKLSMIIVLGVLLCTAVFAAVGHQVAFASSAEYDRGYRDGYAYVRKQCESHSQGYVALASEDYEAGYHDGYEQAYEKYCR